MSKEIYNFQAKDREEVETKIRDISQVITSLEEEKERLKQQWEETHDVKAMRDLNTATNDIARLRNKRDKYLEKLAVYAHNDRILNQYDELLIPEDLDSKNIN